MRKLVCGVGINDADYVVKRVINGKEVSCPYYARWKNMLTRCYSKDYSKKHKSYEECVVCEDWLTFSKFKAWMEKQIWMGKQLDKDILIVGNKLYCPDHCVFVDKNVNLFLTDSAKMRGNFPIGVCFSKRAGKFKATCNDGQGNTTNLGEFNTPDEAHKCWKYHKLSLAHKLADEQTDLRVAEALRVRYIN